MGVMGLPAIQALPSIRPAQIYYWFISANSTPQALWPIRRGIHSRLLGHPKLALARAIRFFITPMRQRRMLPMLSLTRSEAAPYPHFLSRHGVGRYRRPQTNQVLLRQRARPFSPDR